MDPNQRRRPHPRSAAAESEQTFETSLAQLEASLQGLKDRYIQVQTDQATQAHLRQQLATLQAEVTAVQEQLAALEVRLESQLFNWKSQQTVFWQIVRFLGLGLVLGYLLRACAS
jgi:ABC-type phosphate transport system auxiliary subunit